MTDEDFYYQKRLKFPKMCIMKTDGTVDKIYSKKSIGFANFTFKYHLQLPNMFKGDIFSSAFDSFATQHTNHSRGYKFISVDIQIFPGLQCTKNQTKNNTKKRQKIKHKLMQMYNYRNEIHCCPDLRIFDFFSYGLFTFRITCNYIRDTDDGIRIASMVVPLNMRTLRNASDNCRWGSNYNGHYRRGSPIYSQVFKELIMHGIKISKLKIDIRRMIVRKYGTLQHQIIDYQNRNIMDTDEHNIMVNAENEQQSIVLAKQLPELKLKIRKMKVEIWLQMTCTQCKNELVSVIHRFLCKHKSRYLPQFKQFLLTEYELKWFHVRITHYSSGGKCRIIEDAFGEIGEKKSTFADIQLNDKIFVPFYRETKAKENVEQKNAMNVNLDCNRFNVDLNSSQVIFLAQYLYETAVPMKFLFNLHGSRNTVENIESADENGTNARKTSQDLIEWKIASPLKKYQLRELLFTYISSMDIIDNVLLAYVGQHSYFMAKIEGILYVSDIEKCRRINEYMDDVLLKKESMQSSKSFLLQKSTQEREVLDCKSNNHHLIYGCYFTDVFHKQQLVGTASNARITRRKRN